jgi:uncharacterized protein
MTPQERELIAELFDRLSSLEGAERDPDAERAIAEGLSRAPNAVYPLVQTVLLQDEALKRANARIQALEGGDGSDSVPRGGGSFLANMRGALFGSDAGSRASVPSVRTGATSEANQPPPYTPAPGGSFVGTAAAAAAGTIGGSLMLDSIRSMFGHGHAGAYEPASSAHSPWDNSAGSAANSDLAKQAGIGDVGGGHGSGGDQHAAGLVDDADTDDADDSDDSDDDGDFDDGDFDGGSDTA